jgi:pimeloyl-ACP methyl ester carboxylesterase
LLLLLQVNSLFYNYYNIYVDLNLLNDITALATAGGVDRTVYFGGHSGGSMVAVFGALALTSTRVGNVYLYGHEKVIGIFHFFNYTVSRSCV